eukprot:TRINITY_DN3141_c0_g1_i1.p1 TRINITY_DN3141_c0_g1~~TRINITY_DN3141_c0_g1_i1.p1  ORF type:complete len:698 (+),score=141.64 TRINITY_DN3141_c0_g1_i1:55-2094(+)
MYGKKEYLELLSQRFPNKQAVATEIVNLETSANLPKGTEHFLSDLHGEYEAFSHLLRSCSGVVKRHISEIFAATDTNAPVMPEAEQNDLAALIYYPQEFIANVESSMSHAEMSKWYRKQLFNLIAVAQSVCSKYTRKHVMKCIPKDYEHMIAEVLQHTLITRELASDHWIVGRVESNKERYFRGVINSIVDVGRGAAVCCVLSDLISRLAVDHLHIVGDIYDRGPAAHDIMESLCNYHSVDIQWGNHDVLWMAAAAGSEVAICTTIRIALRYSNMTTLEDAYGIAMFPLAQLALKYYSNDEKAVKVFKPKKSSEKTHSKEDTILLAKMQKAIAIMQFKLEGTYCARQPGFNMLDRIMLHTLDKEKGTITINDIVHPLNDTFFPTIDPKDPHKLNDDEALCMRQLLKSFTSSRWLQKHMDLLWSHGSMYTCYNGNLLLHGAVPMDSKGKLASVKLDGKLLSGKQYCDALETKARQCRKFAPGTEQHQDGVDTLYYLWTGSKSPLFGKERMTTFERYFIDDKKTHIEPRDPYLKNRNTAEVSRTVLKAFGLNPTTGVIINGHTPVKVKKGESPIKAEGRLIVIDGGLSKAYQKETGIAGYTLIFNSYGMLLSEHKGFRGKEAAISSHADNHARTMVVSNNNKRLLIRDTDKGKMIQAEIEVLYELLKAYNNGEIPERKSKL